MAAAVVTMAMWGGASKLQDQDVYLAPPGAVGAGNAVAAPSGLLEKAGGVVPAGAARPQEPVATPAGPPDLAALLSSVMTGNPYKAAIDAQDLPPAARQTVHIYVRQRCVAFQHLQILRGRGELPALPAGTEGRAADAMALLDARCRPVLQDEHLMGRLYETWRGYLQVERGLKTEADLRHWLREGSVHAWVILHADPNGNAEVRRFAGLPWGGLSDLASYNRAVHQALIGAQGTSGGTQHIESLYLCAKTGACDVPPDRIAVYDLPAAEQARVLAVARAMQREIQAGNTHAFSPLRLR